MSASIEWLHGLMRNGDNRKTRRTQRRHAATRPTFRLRHCLEQLEDRTAQAVISVTSSSDTIAIDGFATLREAVTSINNQADVNADVTLNQRSR